MKTLEIKPLKDKKLNVLIIEKEYNEPFWLVEPRSALPQEKLSLVHKHSIAFCTYIEGLIKRVKPDFAI